MKKIRLGLAALAASLTLAACSGPDDGDGTSTAVDPGASAPETRDPVEHPANNNEDDIEFVQRMIPHHEQGVELSGIILAKEGLDPRVEELAEHIRDTQVQESRQMRAWLDGWHAPPPEATDMDHSDMDGMLDPGQLTEIRDADTPEAQELFLDHMIDHHEGAVSMARRHLDSGQNEEARTLSERIVRTQRAEIAEMKEIRGSL